MSYGHEGGYAFNEDQRGGHWHIYKAACDPEANGNRPQPGDVRFTIQIRLEHGEFLQVTMGKKGRDLLFGMLIADCHDSNEPEPETRKAT